MDQGIRCESNRYVHTIMPYFLSVEQVSTGFAAIRLESYGGQLSGCLPLMFAVVAATITAKISDVASGRSDRAAQCEGGCLNGRKKNGSKRLSTGVENHSFPALDPVAGHSCLSAGDDGGPRVP